MGKLIGLIAVVFAGVIAWRIGGRLSPDAIGMALGVLFGMLAGIPVVLLVLASQRQNDQRPASYAEPRRPLPPPGPVIILTGGSRVLPNQNRPKPQYETLLSDQRSTYPARRVEPDPDSWEDWEE